MRKVLVVFVLLVMTACAQFPLGPSVYTCAARDREVKAYVDEGGQVPTIKRLTSGERVYIVDSPRGYDVTHYDGPECVK